MHKPCKKPVWINQTNYKQLVCSVVVQFYDDGGELRYKMSGPNSDSLLASLLKA